jgi:hypothetical protein
MAFRLSRRAMLRGLGTVAIGLPVLDVMLDDHGEALADNTPLPMRFLICFMGQSLGADNDSSPTQWVPTNMGAGYDLKPGLAPIQPVQDLVSIVSGLKIPWAQENAGMIVAGGRSDNFHIQSLCPLLTGVRNISATNGGLNGATSDQVVAEAISASQKFKSLVYRVQASWYLDQSAPYGRDIISARFDQNTMKVVPIPAQVSPQAAFSDLFMGGVPMDPIAKARADFLLKQRKSILDLVDKRTDRLIPQLGSADRIKMQQHLDEIRDLERRINAMQPVYTQTCKVPMDPGADPMIGGDQMGTAFDITKGYSNEELRAQVFSDLIHMAFVCDLTRSASLQYTMAQSHLNLYPAIGGAPFDVHELGHSAKTVDMTKAHAWHTTHFAYLVAKFRDTMEGTGSVIDNTVMLLVNEGGHGFDPEANRAISSHSTEEMTVLIAGKAAGLKPGKHIRKAGMHPVTVVNSAMQAVGVNKNLGEVAGTIPELFV